MDHFISLLNDNEAIQWGMNFKFCVLVEGGYQQ